MYKIKKRGQSTVEYVLLVAAVIAVMIAFTTQPKSGVQGQLNSTLNQAYSTVGDMTERLANSEQASNGASNPPPYTVNVNP